MRQTLRADQQELVDKVLRAMRLGHRRILVRAPTGFGKSTVMAHLAERADRHGARTWICVHRDQLAKQACERVQGQGVACGIVMAGPSTCPGACVQVVSIPTINARLTRLALGEEMSEMELPPAPALLFLDEAHHSDCESWARVRAYAADGHVVGLTATPWNPDGSALSGFDIFIDGPSPRDLVGEGLPLVPPVIFSAPAPRLDDVRVMAGEFALRELAKRYVELTGDVIKTWRRLADGLRTLVFAVSKQHSNDLVRSFVEAGVPAEHVDDQTSPEERNEIFGRLRRGETLIVSNVGIVTEGFDAPSVECVVLARATRSEALYLQMVGRGVRAADGKTRCVILDHGRNAQRHGHPFADRPMDLATGRRKHVKRLKEEEVAGDEEHFRVCPECLCCCPPTATDCVWCGQKTPWGRRVRMNTKIELIEQTKEDLDSEMVKRALSRRKAWYAMESLCEKWGRSPWSASYSYRKMFGIMPHDDAIFHTAAERAAYWEKRKRQPGAGGDGHNEAQAPSARGGKAARSWGGSRRRGL
jgi:superfamily II DNA or RNA helicase